MLRNRTIVRASLSGSCLAARWPNHIHSIGHTLGFFYEDGAIIPDGTTPPDRTPRYYRPTDRPGSRYPHFWLDAARTRSTLDLFDRELVLMIGPDGDAWADAASAAAERTGLPILVHRLSETARTGGCGPARTGRH